MEMDLSIICSKTVKILNLSVETVWYFRQQYFFRGSQKLNELIGLIQEIIQYIVDLAGEETLANMGLAMLMDAQEKNDEILIADIIEGQVVPCLEELIQQMEQQIPIERFDFLQHNLQVLKKAGETELVQRVETADGYENCTYTPEYTASGQITICLSENGKNYYVSGNNNPYRDAIHFVQGNMEQERYQYILFGAGMFYEAEVLLNHRPDAEVVVVEEDPYLLQMAMKYRDISELLGDERFSMECCSFEDYIRKVDLEKFGLLFRKPSMKHIQTDTSRMVMERFFLKCMTIKEQAYVLEKEFRQNIKRVDEIHSIDECRDNFVGRTVYLVAGGPSLDESIDVLRSREENSIVLCVGTSAAKLKGEGIVPDYVIITDVAEAIYDQIHQNVDPRRTSLFYMISANAKAVSSYNGAKYAIFQKGFDMAEEYAGEKGYMLVSTGGSVTTTAVDICIQFECKKVICLGLDFAYTNNMTHASGTRSQREVLTEIDRPMVKSVSGEMIPTSLNLSCYHKWIEHRIQNEKQTCLINVSDGAYIQGMKNVPTKDRWNL